LLTSIEEILTIGREAKLPVHISHMKASGRKAWGKAADAIALVNRARAAGQEVTADQYPYVASSTSLAAIVIPPRFREGTSEDSSSGSTTPNRDRVSAKPSSKASTAATAAKVCASPPTNRDGTGKARTCPPSPTWKTSRSSTSSWTSNVRAALKW